MAGGNLSLTWCTDQRIEFLHLGKEQTQTPWQPVSEEVVLRGSLMSAAQRRDWVLDRLIVESEAGGDSARVRSLELLGKTAGLFIDRAEVSVIGGSDSVKARIEAMLADIAGRTIEHEPSCADPYLVLPDPDAVPSEGDSGAV